MKPRTNVSEEQMELHLGNIRRLRTAGRRERHLHGRAHWWFERMRRAIEDIDTWETRQDKSVVLVRTQI
jgi:hypothetical protein